MNLLIKDNFFTNPDVLRRMALDCNYIDSEKVKVDVGGLNNYTEERYAILLDLEFTGTLYKDVEFLIDDRGDRTPILLNRQIMRMLKVSVNPERKYIITTKYNINEE